MLKNRRSRLKLFFEEYSLKAVLFTDLRNIRYLCGFSGTEGALLVVAGSCVVLVRFALHCPGC